MNSSKSLGIRWLILAVGVVTMLFAGIIYAWSIIKSPFAGLGFEAEDLAFNFTLTMSFFCIGGLLSTQLVKLLGVRLTIILSGVLAGAGFVLSSLLGEGQTVLLYLTYALMAGLGIGIVYITIISSVNAWFPDRKGLSSGALMMGFGASSLVLGNIADNLLRATSDGKKHIFFSVFFSEWCFVFRLYSSSALIPLLPFLSLKSLREKGERTWSFFPPFFLGVFVSSAVTMILYLIYFFSK